MVNVVVKTDISEGLRFLDQRVQRQVPFAAKNALNQVATLGKAAVVKDMSVRFDRPTPFTLRSLYIKYATTASLKAMVYVKDRELAKSKPLAESIGHEFSGGTRIRKRLEYWLTSAGYISSNEFVVPGAGAKLDAYGNMTRGQIQQILSQLRAGPDAAAFSSDSKRSKSKVARAGEYFWSYGSTRGHNGNLTRGVWHRKSGGRYLKPVLLVIGRPSYRRRIDMDRIVGDVADRQFDLLFGKALSQAIATAR